MASWQAWSINVVIEIGHLWNLLVIILCSHQCWKFGIPRLYLQRSLAAPAAILSPSLPSASMWNHMKHHNHYNNHHHQLHHVACNNYCKLNHVQAIMITYMIATLSRITMSMLMLAKIELTIRHGTNHTSSSPGVCSGSCIHHNLHYQEAYMNLSIE